MYSDNSTSRFAQSASALGAALLGFGVGAKWGYTITNFAIVIIIVGAIFHIWGMYVMQIKNQSKTTEISARVVWISAWICLIALVGIIIYLLAANKK